MQESNKFFMSNCMLIIASAIWGSCFLFQKLAATQVGAFSFMACRSFLGMLTLLIIIAYTRYHKSKKKEPLKEEESYIFDKKYFKRLFLIAPFCGIINVMGSVLVQEGLAYTTASKAGFINAIYIIFVPVIGLFFSKKTGPRILWGIVFAVIGLYNLCVTGTITSIQKGDLIILGSTLLFALHIQLISKYVQEFVGLHFSCVEFGFASIFCGVISIFFEDTTLEQIAGCGINILYAGILGIGVCYALQVTAQKYTDPTVAALLMSLESVFSAICGVVFLKETFTLREVVGILFIIVAIVVAQLPEKEKKAKRCRE